MNAASAPAALARRRALVGPVTGNRKSKMPYLNVGDDAPDFTVKAHDGSDVRLSDLRGKNVVLWFYPVADTPG